MAVATSCSAGGGSGPTATAAEPPVLVVPRFNGGSMPTRQVNAFWYRRGFPASRLRLGDTYGPLLADLRSGGPAASVIGAGYDWRMPAAPPQAEFDGAVTGLLAHWNDPESADTFAYAVDYLKYWLIRAVESNPGADRVDIVAHSTGVSIVRAYLQSDAYGQMVLGPDGNPVRLPTIGTFVLAVPPQQGAPFVWNLWNGNFASFVGAARGADIFRGYSRAYDRVRAGGAITGPTDDITKSDLEGTGIARQVSFLRRYNPLFRVVLPTYPFLHPNRTPGRAPTTINADPDSRNELLLDLNATSSPGSNPWAELADRVVVTYPVHVLAPPAAPDSPVVSTDVMNQQEVGTGGSIVPFTAFDRPKQRGIPTTPGQTWYREIYASDAGDGAFPLRSMQEMFFDSAGQPDPGVEIRQWGNGASPPGDAKAGWVPTPGNLSHNLFIENPEITSWISRQIRKPG